MRTCFGILGLGLLLMVSACAVSGMMVSDAKLLPDNSSVSLSAKVVTYAGADFFYIEEDSRCMGIRAEKTAHGLTVGMRADVAGTMKTGTNRERYVLATSAVQTAPPNANGTVAPIGMNNVALGGANWHVVGTGGQREVSNSLGLNNIGLLVKTWGIYQQIDATTFTVDDGSGLLVKCAVPSGTFLSSGWQYVSVTGVSSMFRYNASIYPPNILVRDIQVSLPCEMIYIPAGTFLMGNNGSEGYSNSNELPQHSVNLPDYYIGKYEVTRGEYRQFMNAGGYSTQSYWSAAGWSWKGSRTEPDYWAASQNWGSPPGTFTQTDNHPVVGVSYYEAEAFCNWAGGHLPTEAQWERAARWTGTHANVYPWGDTWDVQKCNNWDDTLYPRYRTVPVGSYSSYPSPSGCQDMAGSAWEWCKDWYDWDYYSHSPTSDPQGLTSGSYRVVRGGSWTNYGDWFRCAYRNYGDPGSYVWDSSGFRLAYSAETSAIPTFAPDGGTYDLPQTVTMSCATEGATIHYTTDGSTPTCASQTYTGPVSVDHSLALKAIACKEGWNPSDVKTAEYVINFPQEDFPLPGGGSVRMILIPAGGFLMGNSGIGDDVAYSNSDELPQHSVTLSAYYIGKYEVTRGEYRAFMTAGGYSTQSYWSTDGWSWKGSRTEPDNWAASQNWGSPPGAFLQTDNYPVVGVSYYEAEAFCNWAGGHLPTEAQWERAARWTGTHANVYPWGDTWDVQKCNDWNDTLYPGYQTAPVGSYSSCPSPSGCQDMAGNVWEWCKDWYGSTYYSQSPTSDPQGPASGDNGCRVLRGGSFYPSDSVYYYRCAFRNGWANPNYYSWAVGFRLAR